MSAPALYPGDLRKLLGGWQQLALAHKRKGKRRYTVVFLAAGLLAIGGGFLIPDAIPFPQLLGLFTLIFGSMWAAAQGNTLAVPQIDFLGAFFRQLLGELPPDAKLRFHARVFGAPQSEFNEGRKAPRGEFLKFAAPLGAGREMGIQISFASKRKGRRKLKGYKQKFVLGAWMTGVDPAQAQCDREALIQAVEAVFAEGGLSSPNRFSEGLPSFRDFVINAGVSDGVFSFKLKRSVIVSGENFEPSAGFNPKQVLAMLRAASQLVWKSS